MNKTIHNTLRTLSSLISGGPDHRDDGSWTLALARSTDPAEAFAPMARALHVLLDWSASTCTSDAVAMGMIDAGGADLVCKVLAEATLVAPPEQAGVVPGQEDVVVGALEHIRERCLSILTNLTRFPASSTYLLSSSPLVSLAVFSLHNEADPLVLQTSLRLIQTLLSVHTSPSSLPHLLPLVSALLDNKSIHHLVFIATHTLNVRLFTATLTLVSQLVWITHKRLALDAADTGDTAFPVVERDTVRALVAHVVAAMTCAEGKGLELDWQAATASVECLLTLAQIGAQWQALVGAHARELFRVFALLWPSLVLDADEDTASKWVRLVARLPEAGWPPVVDALVRAREGDGRVQRALDKWGEVALVYQLPLGMVGAVSREMSAEAVRRLVREVPEAVEAVKEVSGEEGGQVHEELMAKANGAG